MRRVAAAVVLVLVLELVLGSICAQAVSVHSHSHGGLRLLFPVRLWAWSGILAQRFQSIGGEQPSAAAPRQLVGIEQRISDPDRMLSEEQRKHIAELLDSASVGTARTKDRCGLDVKLMLAKDASHWGKWEPARALPSGAAGDGAVLRYGLGAVQDGERPYGRRLGWKTEKLLGQARMEEIDGAVREATLAVGGGQQNLYQSMQKLGRVFESVASTGCEADASGDAVSPPPLLHGATPNMVPKQLATKSVPSETTPPATSTPRTNSHMKAGKRQTARELETERDRLSGFFGDMGSNIVIGVPLMIFLYMFSSWNARTSQPRDSRDMHGDDMARLRGDYAQALSSTRSVGSGSAKKRAREGRKAARAEAARRATSAMNGENISQPDRGEGHEEPRNRWGLFNNPLVTWGYAQTRGSSADYGTGDLTHRDAPVGPRDPSGLMNRGNYCFMNAALQCLFATPGFIRAAEESPVHRHGDMLATLTKLAGNVLNGQQTSAALEAVRAQCEAVLPPDIQGGKFVVAEGDNPLPFWRGGMIGRQRQQDAHEFLVKLMDVLDTVATPASGKQHSPASAGKLSPSPIGQLFELRKEEHGCCSVCGKEWKMNAHPSLFEEALVHEGAVAAAYQMQEGASRGKRGNNRVPEVSLNELLKTKYNRAKVILDCEGCEADAKKRLDWGGGVPDGHFAGAPSAGCEMQILIPPDSATILAAEDRSKAAPQRKQKQLSKTKDEEDVKKCPKREMPSQNPNTGWVVLENLIAERMGVAWAELRYVPQFSDPYLLPPLEPMGQTAEKILQFQVAQELKKQQIRATVHGDEEFHADTDLQVDFSDGMEFQMMDRTALAPTRSHNWGELVQGRPDVGDTKVFSWEQWQHELRHQGHLPELDGDDDKLLPLMVSPWILQLKVPTVTKYEILATAPRHYAVHLNRHTPTGQLDKSGVVFDDLLDLSFAAGENHNCSWIYSLYAVCFHIGSTPNTGHYFAYVKIPLENTGF